MAEERAQRHLAAILAADVVGYSRLMEQNEADTFERLRAHRKQLFEPEIAKHHGRVFKLMGDGLLAEFGSVVDAVECAVALQRGMAARNNGVPAEQRIEVRIGVNLGDVIVEGEDRHGEGVNIAARLQQLAEPGGIRVSGKVAQEVEKKLAFGFESMGEQHMKNIAEPVHVYRVLVDGTAARAPRRRLARRISRPMAMAAAFIGLVAVGVAVNWDRIRDWIDVTPPPVPGSRIAVLPFTSEGGDPCNTAFSAGLAQDIGAALVRFSDVSVVSGESTERSTAENVDVREVGYKLDGSIECSADGLRVTARLRSVANVDETSVYQDISLADAKIPTAREELAGLLAGGIASLTTELWEWELEKTDAQLKRNPTDLLKAYYCVLLSYEYINTLSAADHKAARDCLIDAVDRVPAYAVAWARLGFMYFDEVKYGYNPRPDGNSLKDARDAADQSIDLDARMAEGYHVLALLYYYTEQGFDSFHKEANKAIAKNPYNGGIVGELGIWTFYSGDWERGKALIEKARKIYTDDPRWLDFPGVLDHYRKGEYGEAKAAALATELRKGAVVQTVLAAAYGQLGELENARRTIDEILKIHPEFKDNPRAPFQVRKMPTELIEAVMDGLRKAGFEVAPPG